MQPIRNLIVVFSIGAVSVGAAAGCAARQGKAFEDMTAAEHRQAAHRERQKAWDEAGKASDQLHEVPTPGWIEGPATAGGAYYFFDATWDPMEPEHYTVEERVRVRGEDHADSAQRHREKAARHDRAARELDELQHRRVE